MFFRKEESIKEIKNIYVFVGVIMKVANVTLKVLKVRGVFQCKLKR
jgi:hypothetical protein